MAKAFSKIFVRGEGQFIIWGLISKGFSFINSFAILSSLSLFEYGAFQLLISIDSFLSDASGIGSNVLSNDMLRLIGEGREDRAKRLYLETVALRLGLGILSWAAIFFGAPLIAAHLGSGYGGIVRIFSFLIIADVVAMLVKSLISMRMEFGALASRSSVAKFVQVATLGAFFTTTGIGLREVVISQVLSSLAATLSLLNVAVRAYAPWKNLPAAPGGMLLRVFRSYGKWEIIRPYLSKVTSDIKPWLIKLFVSTEAVAIFSVATQMVAAYKSLLSTNTLATLLALRLKQRELVRTVYIYGTKYLVLASLVIVAAGMVSAPIIMALIFPRYVPALPFFYLLIFVIPPKIFWQMIDIYLIVLRKQRFIFFRAILFAGASIGFLALFLPLFGIWGMVLAEIAIVLLMASVTYRYFIRINPTYRITARTLFTFGPDDRTILSLMVRQVRDAITAGLKMFKLWKTA